MKNETRLERLKELEYMLMHHRALFKEKGVTFDLGNWGEKICDFASALFFQKKAGKAVRPDDVCGFAACALGSAALYEPFIKQGLKMLSNEVNSCEVEDESGLQVLEYTAMLTPSYKGERGLGAGECFFGLSSHETTRLFMPESYQSDAPTPKEVAGRVRELIKNYA